MYGTGLRSVRQHRDDVNANYMSFKTPLVPSVLACIATCRTANVIPIRDFRGRRARLSVHRDATLFSKPVPLTGSLAQRVALSVDSSAGFFPVTPMRRADRDDTTTDSCHEYETRGDDDA